MKVGSLNDSLTSALIKSDAVVGVTACRELPGKVTEKTMELIAKRKNMNIKVSCAANWIELAELSKLINTSK